MSTRKGWWLKILPKHKRFSENNNFVKILQNKKFPWAICMREIFAKDTFYFRTAHGKGQQNEKKEDRMTEKNMREKLNRPQGYP